MLCLLTTSIDSAKYLQNTRLVELFASMDCAIICGGFPNTLPIHTYCLPDSVAWIESIVNVLEYSETLSLCTRSLDRIASSFIGPNVMFTINGMSTVSSNCTVQVKLGDDPANIV